MIRFALAVLFSIGNLFAFQSAFYCSASGGTPRSVRSDGIAELVNDVVLSCTGGQAGQTAYYSLQVFFNTNYTGRILDSGSLLTESLLLVDDPSTPIPGTNLFQGTLATANSISFPSIALTMPGAGTPRTIRITNLRANVAALGVQSSGIGQIYASVNASFPISNHQVQLANIVGSPGTELEFAL